MAKVMQDLKAEYEVGETVEARAAKDADKLETLLQAMDYQAQGHDTVPWQETSIDALRTDSGREYRTRAGDVRYTVDEPDGSRRSLTRRTGPHGEKWTTRKAALEALEDLRSAMRKGDHVDPARTPLSMYLEEWLGGLRLAPSTIASYRRTSGCTSRRSSAACRWRR
jgi:hypothetical protein